MSFVSYLNLHCAAVRHRNLHRDSFLMNLHPVKVYSIQSWLHHIYHRLLCGGELVLLFSSVLAHGKIKLRCWGVDWFVVYLPGTKWWLMFLDVLEELEDIWCVAENWEAWTTDSSSFLCPASIIRLLDTGNSAILERKCQQPQENQQYITLM